MENESLSFTDLMGLLRRRISLFGLTFVALLSATVLLAFGLPSVYDSSGTILIEQQNIPDNLVQSTITSYADERIQVISQRVMSTDNLANLVQKHELYGYGEDEESIVAKVRRLEDSITIEPVSADIVNPTSGRPSEVTIAFNVTYRDKSPQTARDLAGEVVELFLEENRRSRAEQTLETVSFLETQSLAYQGEIDRLEQEIAAFKTEYQGLLPENVNFNMQSLDRQERRLTDIQYEIRIQEERIRFLQDEKRTLIEEAGGSIDRMAELQEEYVRVSALYAPDHPDVLRVRREIELLLQNSGEDQTASSALAIATVRAELAAARDRYTPDHPDVRRLERTLAALEAQSGPIDNEAVTMVSSPAVREVESEIRERTVSLEGLRRSARELEQEIRGIESNLSSVPEIERQYRLLSRRYADAVERHDEVLQKLATARMASRLETEQLGERFTLIDSPRVPDQPASPNRVGILMLGIVLAGALSVAMLAIVEVSDSSIRNVRDVREVLGIPPIATIPTVETRSDRHRRIARNLVNVSFAGLMVIGAVAGIYLAGP